MKVLQIVILLLLVSTATFWGGITYQKQNSTTTVSDELLNPYRKQTESMLKALLNQYMNNLSQGVTNAATVLSKNRDFVLSYYLDRDLNSPVVSGVASQYGELLAVDGFTVRNSDSLTLSTFGITPQENITPEGVEFISDSTGALWLGTSARAGIGKEELTLQAWIRVDSSRLLNFSQVTRSELLIMKSDAVLLSTLSNIESLHLTTPSSVMIDSVETPIISTVLSDSLTMLSLSPIKGNI